MYTQVLMCTIYCFVAGEKEKGGKGKGKAAGGKGGGKGKKKKGDKDESLPKILPVCVCTILHTLYSLSPSLCMHVYRLLHC